MVEYNQKATEWTQQDRRQTHDSVSYGQAYALEMALSNRLGYPLPFGQAGSFFYRKDANRL